MTEPVRRFVAVLGAEGGFGPVFARLLGDASGMALADAPIDVNDALLDVLRATRSAAPELGKAWFEAPDIASIAEQAVAAVPDGGVVWFDSTTATLFDFWRHAAMPDLCVIVRDSAAVVVDALQRGGLEPAHALALWARTDREAVLAPVGLAAITVDARRVVEDPEAVLDQFEHACTLSGLRVEPGRMLELWHAECSAAGFELDRSNTGTGSGLTFEPMATTYHPTWNPDEGPELAAWCDELLRAHLRAHRAGLEARDAWVSQGAAETSLEDRARFAAAERELNFLRDQIIGLEAERANLATALAALDGQWRESQARVESLANRLVDLDELEDARRDRDQMLASPEWRAGRLVLGPLRRLRRWLARSS